MDIRNYPKNLNKMKINKQPIIKRKEYSKEELDSLFNEVHGNLCQDSRTRWLEKHGAIIRRPYGKTVETSVVKLADGSFPYSELSDKWAALEKRENYKDYDKKVIKSEISRSTEKDNIIDIPEDEDPDEDVEDLKELNLFD